MAAELQAIERPRGRRDVGAARLPDHASWHECATNASQSRLFTIKTVMFMIAGKLDFLAINPHAWEPT